MNNRSILSSSASSSSGKPVRNLSASSSIFKNLTDLVKFLGQAVPQVSAISVDTLVGPRAFSGKAQRPKSLSISSSVMTLELLVWLFNVFISLLVRSFHALFLLIDMITSATWAVKFKLFFTPTEPLLLLFFTNDIIIFINKILAFLICLFNNNFMKSKGLNQKIPQIISISQNYKLHRHNLETIKPVIGSVNKKRELQISKMAKEKLRYRQAVRDFSRSSLDRENTKIVNRLAELAHQNKNKGQSQFSTHREYRNQNQQQLGRSRSSKRLHSASSTKSLTSVCSNIRRRTLKQKEIEEENEKMAKRILNHKAHRTLALAELNKSYSKYEQDVKTRSRFSQKNQEVIRSLALQGLKFDKKDVQYLPQIVSKRKSGSMSKSISNSKI